MKIGLVLNRTPSNSEKFLISKIKGLQQNGHQVIMFAHKDDNFNLCEVVDMPKVSNIFFLQIIKMIMAYISIIFKSPIAAAKFLIYEKLDGRPFRHRWENLYLNSKILNAKLNWIHFCFSTTVIRKENVARSIKAKMSISLRGYDINIYPLKNHNCYSILWQKVDKVHSISNSLLEKAKDYGLKSSVDKKVIFPAINTNRFRNKKIKSELNLNRTIEILTVARLNWIKGLEYTIEAVSKLNSVRFNYRIVGSGSDYERLVLAINQLDLTNKVKLMGYIPHEKITSYYERADLYIQYSIEEGFCNAVLEAQSMGVLTIVSDASGLSENIIHGKTGWVVPKREPILLAEKIKQILLMENKKLDQIRLNGIRRVENKFELNSQNQQFNRFFNEDLF